jgi:hypothetical protein
MFFYSFGHYTDYSFFELWLPIIPYVYTNRFSYRRYSFLSRPVRFMCVRFALHNSGHPIRKGCTRQWWNYDLLLIRGSALRINPSPFHFSTFLDFMDIAERKNFAFEEKQQQSINLKSKVQGHTKITQKVWFNFYNIKISKLINIKRQHHIFLGWKYTLLQYDDIVQECQRCRHDQRTYLCLFITHKQYHMSL